MATVSFSADIFAVQQDDGHPHMAGFGVLLAEYSYMSVRQMLRMCWAIWMGQRLR